MNRTRRAELAALTALGLAGCQSAPVTLHSASLAADRIARLGWFMTALGALILLTVIVIQWLSVRRGLERDPVAVDLGPHKPSWIVWGGAVMPTVVLVIVFLVGSSALGRFPVRANASDLVVHVSGRQWWWRFEYDGRNPGDEVVTANELHIPVGKSVRLLLTSQDVIHSFWVPALQGKLDLIPGDTNELRLIAERPGRYDGRCAEFCGVQHAHMSFTVVAESPDDFERWLAGQQAPAREPTDSETLAGRQLVVGGACAFCHRIKGTEANGRVAPDLTHLASRATIASGTLPNTPGYLEAWITNAPSLKPGTQMPALPQFSGRELRAITAYLRSLN
jgi:cytochrome c oxidase subunit 2